ncbi:Mechanosensitive ion channel protein 8 [Bienertia sinuspersici]
MGTFLEQQRSNEIRQALQGLPPLYPDGQPRKSLSRLPSDVQSPDFVNSSNNSTNAYRLTNMLNNHSNSNSNNLDNGSRETRVVRCTSNNSSSRKISSTVSIAKTKSRLMDPPMTPLDQRSPSGMIHNPAKFRTILIGRGCLENHP